MRRSLVRVGVTIALTLLTTGTPVASVAMAAPAPAAVSGGESATDGRDATAYHTSWLCGLA
jgi:hypothetical protein